MKSILTTIFTCLTLFAFADIPRVDVIEVEYQGKKYFKWEFLSHLKFEEGCVFDRHSGEYLFEETDYFQNRNNGDVIELYQHLITIPKVKVFSGYDSTQEYSSHHLSQLSGSTLKLSGKQLDSIEIFKIHIGNTAGYTYSPKLSKEDEDWIHDYKLERIVKFNDGELCDIELFTIKDNISKKEAQGIKTEIRSLYKAVLSTNGYSGKTPDEYFNELLERNILMIGFCSC